MKEWERRFYKSKEWRYVRLFVINRDESICKLCGEFVLDSPVVHHKVCLTEQNYSNPDISLNPALLETLHHDCHNVRHGRFGGEEKETIVDDALNVDYSRR